MQNTPPFDEESDGPTCHKCGYILRGLRSPNCSECGEPRVRRISYFERQHFDAIRAALDLADVPYAYHDPTVGVVGMHNLLDGVNFQPVLFIRWRDLRNAEAAIEQVGLTPPVALIDETHPYCPCCGFLLPPPDQDECRCAVCGTICAWYDPADTNDDDFQHDPAGIPADEPH